MWASLLAFSGFLFFCSFGCVDAFWRMVCGTIQTGRIDPIVSPGGIAGHCHTIAGPINLNITSTYASLQAAYCTSCQIQADKSAYWTPQLYYRHRNGTYEYVHHDGTVVYYLGRGTNITNLVPFPPGFRVLSGDSGARAYDSTTLTFNGARPIADRVDFACLDIAPGPEFPYMFSTDCISGLRAQIHFPSCWNGRDLYKSDQSHVAYLSTIDNGDCPPGYPYLFIHMFFEVLYAVNNINKTDGGYFVFSNGDTTGFGFHGDFLNGWDPAVLQAGIAQCATNGTVPSDCAPFLPSIDPYFSTNCPEQPPQINETVTGLLNAMPGCNPPSGQTARAPQNICAVQPALNFVPNTDNLQRYNPKPGDLLGNWSYLGCTNDITSTKPLTGPTYTDLTGMTIETCTTYCHNAGYPVAALEASNKCYCGFRLLPSNPILSPLVCSGYSYEICSGNGLEYCGGNQLMTLWNDTLYTGPPILPFPTYNVTTLLLPSGVVSYQGCRQEPAGSRALTGLALTNATGMTLELCAAFCVGKGYTLFGTEYSTQCFCGNSVTAAIVGEGNCSMACMGNLGEICGGPSKISVYGFPNYVAPPVAAATSVIATGTATGEATGTTTAAVVINTALNNVTYFGCYSDSSPRNIMPGFLANNSVSVSLCATIAQQLNLPIFGLEYSTQCLYGNSLSSASTLLSAAKCYQPCGGIAAQICGGPSAMSVYNNTLYVTPINPNPATASGLSNQFAYLGCYSEPVGAKALGGGYISPTTTDLSVESCAAICVGKGYSYMGVENGNLCYCAAAIANGAALSTNGDEDCSITCSGNGTEWCGATSKINIYHKIG